MLEIVGATGKNFSTNACATLKLRDTNTAAVNVGGAIQFQGFKTSTSAIGNFVAIDGIKENGTAADESGAFRIFTSNSSGTLTEKLRVASDGNVGIGTSTPTSKLNVYGSGSNLSVFKTDGSSGTLFEVTDNLSGSLFSVNTISGIPVLEVFSDNTIVAGTYGTNVLVLTGSSVGIGTSRPPNRLHISSSSNPLERVGRSLFAGAYKANDAKLAAAKLKTAAASDASRNKQLGVKLKPGG
jgi:hypothetical protein